MDFYKDTCYFLTYSTIYAFNFISEDRTIKKVKRFTLLSQKEALSIDSRRFYVANERTTRFRKQKIKTKRK
jgi:hypothetical protein